MDMPCFSIAELIIDEANEQFADVEIDKGKIAIFKQYCEVFDELMEDFYASEFSVSIDKNDHTVNVSVQFGEVDGSSRGDTRLIQLIERSIEVSLSSMDGEHILMSFTFPSLWEESYE